MSFLAAGISIATSIYGIRQQSAAAKAQAGYQTAILKRREEDERNTLRENSRRALIDRERALAEVRVSQAARGFSASGTNLAVFGEIENQLDDRINQASNQALDSISQIQGQSQMIRFSEQQRKSAIPMQYAGAFIKGATQAYAGGKQDYALYGDKAANPFGIFSS